MTSLAIRVAAALLVLLATTGCPPSTPTITTEEIDLGNFRVDLAAAEGTAVNREIMIFGGSQTTAMQVTLTVSFLIPDARVVVGAADGGVTNEVDNETLTSDEIAGNVARIAVTVPQGTQFPTVVVHSIRVRRTSTGPMPVVVPQLANRVSAFPLLPEQTVDVAFPAVERPHHFSFVAPRDGVYDVGWFGAGRLWLSAVNDTDFPFADVEAADQIPRPASTVPFTRLQLTAGDTLRMTATNAAAAAPQGCGRIVVMEKRPQLELAFPSSGPGAFVPQGIGVDTDPNNGTRGGFGGELDCTAFDGGMGIARVPGTDEWFVPPRIPPCYDDHRGTDWALVLGPLGQILGAPVNAAAPGVVLAVDDMNADVCFYDVAQKQIRCFGGTPDAPAETAPVDNFVAIRHDDGEIGYYVHGMRGASVVVPGQRVGCLELLTPAASAGDSSGPHLHFELRGLADNAFDSGTPFNSMRLIPVRTATTTIDPFGPNRWRSKTELGVPRNVCQ
jgi:hypothetical protein